jgi:putative transposase
VQLQVSSFCYKATPDPKEPALRQRFREIAAARIRFGYRRLTVMLRREGWWVNAKRVCRLYRLEGLGLGRKRKKKRASHARGPVVAPERPSQLWAMDFVADRLEDGRPIRILTLIDAFTREVLRVWADYGMNGEKVATQLASLSTERELPDAIRVDNGSEFYSRAMGHLGVPR